MEVEAELGEVLLQLVPGLAGGVGGGKLFEVGEETDDLADALDEAGRRVVAESGVHSGGRG